MITCIVGHVVELGRGKRPANLLICDVDFRGSENVRPLKVSGNFS